MRNKRLDSSRRLFLGRSIGLAGGAIISSSALLGACAKKDELKAYQYWSRKDKGDFNEYEYIVMCGVLAASAHNTQPWKFKISNDSIFVFADKKRNLGKADPDLKMMMLSVGCAVENMVIAAKSIGFETSVSYVADDEFSGSGLCAKLKLQKTQTTDKHELFDAIFDRQTVRASYDVTRIVPKDYVSAIENYAGNNDVGIAWMEDDKSKEQLFNIVKRTVRHFANSKSAFEDGMKWFRLSREQWESKGDGISIFTSDSPWIVKQWVGNFTTRVDLTGDLFRQGEVDYSDKVCAATPMWGLVYSKGSGNNLRLKAGRVAERIYLEAAKRGLAIHPVSYPVENKQAVQELKNIVKSGAQDEMLFLFRIGYAPSMEKSVRRDISKVII